MPRNPNAKRGDGQLQITYNEMGQGDSVLIACPNGKVVVIDCGAARWDGNYYKPPATPAQLRDAFQGTRSRYWQGRVDAGYNIQVIHGFFNTDDL